MLARLSNDPSDISPLSPLRNLISYVESISEKRINIQEFPSGPEVSDARTIEISFPCQGQSLLMAFLHDEKIIFSYENGEIKFLFRYPFENLRKFYLNQALILSFESLSLESILDGVPAGLDFTELDIPPHILSLTQLSVHPYLGIFKDPKGLTLSFSDEQIKWVVLRLLQLDLYIKYLKGIHPELIGDSRYNQIFRCAMSETLCQLRLPHHIAEKILSPEEQERCPRLACSDYLLDTRLFSDEIRQHCMRAQMQKILIELFGNEELSKNFPEHLKINNLIEADGIFIKEDTGLFLKLPIIYFPQGHKTIFPGAMYRQEGDFFIFDLSTSTHINLFWDSIKDLLQGSLKELISRIEGLISRKSGKGSSLPNLQQNSPDLPLNQIFLSPSVLASHFVSPPVLGMPYLDYNRANGFIVQLDRLDICIELLQYCSIIFKILESEAELSARLEKLFVMLKNSDEKIQPGNGVFLELSDYFSDFQARYANKLPHSSPVLYHILREFLSALVGDFLVLEKSLVTALDNHRDVILFILQELKRLSPGISSLQVLEEMRRVEALERIFLLHLEVIESSSGEPPHFLEELSETELSMEKMHANPIVDCRPCEQVSFNGARTLRGDYLGLQKIWLQLCLAVQPPCIPLENNRFFFDIFFLFLNEWLVHMVHPSFLFRRNFNFGKNRLEAKMLLDVMEIMHRAVREFSLESQIDFYHKLYETILENPLERFDLASIAKSPLNLMICRMFFSLEAQYPEELFQFFIDWMKSLMLLFPSRMQKLSLEENGLPEQEPAVLWEQISPILREIQNIFDNDSLHALSEEELYNKFVFHLEDGSFFNLLQAAFFSLDEKSLKFFIESFLTGGRFFKKKWKNILCSLLNGSYYFPREHDFSSDTSGLVETALRQWPGRDFIQAATFLRVLFQHEDFSDFSRKIIDKMPLELVLALMYYTIDKILRDEISLNSSWEQNLFVRYLVERCQINLPDNMEALREVRSKRIVNSEQRSFFMVDFFIQAKRFDLLPFFFRLHEGDDVIVRSIWETMLSLIEETPDTSLDEVKKITSIFHELLELDAQNQGFLFLVHQLSINSSVKVLEFLAKDPVFLRVITQVIEINPVVFSPEFLLLCKKSPTHFSVVNEVLFPKIDAAIDLINGFIQKIISIANLTDLHMGFSLDPATYSLILQVGGNSEWIKVVFPQIAASFKYCQIMALESKPKNKKKPNPRICLTHSVFEMEEKKWESIVARVTLQHELMKLQELLEGIQKKLNDNQPYEPEFPERAPALVKRFKIVKARVISILKQMQSSNIEPQQSDVLNFDEKVKQLFIKYNNLQDESKKVLNPVRGEEDLASPAAGESSEINLAMISGLIQEMKIYIHKLDQFVVDKKAEIEAERRHQAERTDKKEARRERAERERLLDEIRKPGSSEAQGNSGGKGRPSRTRGKGSTKSEQEEAKELAEDAAKREALENEQRKNEAAAEERKRAQMDAIRAANIALEKEKAEERWKELKLAAAAKLEAERLRAEEAERLAGYKKEPEGVSRNKSRRKKRTAQKAAGTDNGILQQAQQPASALSLQSDASSSSLHSSAGSKMEAASDVKLFTLRADAPAFIPDLAASKLESLLLEVERQRLKGLKTVEKQEAQGVNSLLSSSPSLSDVVAEIQHDGWLSNTNVFDDSWLVEDTLPPALPTASNAENTANLGASSGVNVYSFFHHHPIQLGLAAVESEPASLARQEWSVVRAPTAYQYSDMVNGAGDN